jgi:hypothetical protein
MSGQHEGLIGNILDKVKDLLTDDDDNRKDPKHQPEDPPLTPQCCGLPPGQTLVAFEHKADCPNHPDNLTAAEKVS